MTDAPEWRLQIERRLGEIEGRLRGWPAPAPVSGAGAGFGPGFGPASSAAPDVIGAIGSLRAEMKGELALLAAPGPVLPVRSLIVTAAIVGGAVFGVGVVVGASLDRGDVADVLKAQVAP